jgi:hypothetical protein
MTEHSQPGATCSACGGEVEDNAAFCPHCGGLFNDSLTCCQHSSEEADGVCVICQRPYCSECATWMGQYYLCDHHAEYTIFEGMAQIFSSPDPTVAQETFSFLEEKGLHPFLVSRSGNLAPSLLRGAHPRGPDIVLIPFGEVIDAEKLIAEHQVDDRHDASGSLSGEG